MLLRPIFCKSFLYGIFPTFAFQSPMMKRTSFWVLVLEGLVGLHRTVQLQLFSVTGQGIDLDYCDIEWKTVFEIAYKYCVLDSCWL